MPSTRVRPVALRCSCPANHVADQSLRVIRDVLGSVYVPVTIELDTALSQS